MKIKKPSVKKSSNDLSTHDVIYRIPGFVVLTVGLFLGYRLVVSLGCKDTDLSLYGANLRSDYTFVFILITVGSLVSFFPFILKILKVYKGAK